MRFSCRWFVIVVAAALGLGSKVIVRQLDEFIESMFPPAVLDDSPFLKGNFAPVSETAPTACKVLIGALPADLEGALLRNGPNPMFRPRGNYHWFDGHAMIHSMRFHGKSQPVYSSHLLETPRQKAEAAEGASLFMNVGDMVGARGMAKMLVEQLKVFVGLIPKIDNLKHGNVNTAFGYHARSGKIYATLESALPFEIGLTPGGGITSIGFDSFKGSVKHQITAHPKYDANTDEMFTFGYHLDSSHHISYSVIGPDATAKRTVQIALPKPVMIHDWAISDTKLVLLDLPLQFDGKNMIASDSGWVFQFNETAPARVGVGPRNLIDSRELQWIDLPGSFFQFHTMSAFDDGDSVVLTGLKMPSFRMDFDYKTVNNHTHLWQWRVNLKEHSVESYEVLESPSEFPTVNMDRMMSARFGYVALWGSSNSIGLQKVGLRKGKPLASLKFGGDFEGGEFVFAPRIGAEDEDDGYLLGFVTGTVEGKHESRVLIYDARTMSAEPVAVVVVPSRVPHGFHAQWIGEQLLRTHMQVHGW